MAAITPERLAAMQRLLYDDPRGDENYRAVHAALADLLEAYAALLAEYRVYQEAVRHELTCGDDGFSHYCGNCGRTIDRNDQLRGIPAPPVKETTA